MYLYVHGYRIDTLRPQACIQRDPAISGGILTIPCVFLFFSSSFFLVRWFVLKVFLQGSSTDFLTRPQVRLDRLAAATRKQTVATLALMAGEPPVVVLFKRIYAGTAGGCATLLHLILPWVR